MISLAFDTLGQDKPVAEAVLAAKLFLQENQETKLFLVGPKKEILKGIQESRQVEIIDTNTRIEHTDGILEVRRKSNASLNQAITLVKNGKADAIISAGASGPYLAASYLILRTLKKDLRPAFAPMILGLKGKPFLILDGGANSDTTIETMINWAIIGQSVVKAMKITNKPIVKLINNGEEEKKGNEFTKEVFLKLKSNKKINFKGNLEPNQLLNNSADVVLVDGFTGNIMIKSYEGMATALLTILKDEIKKSPKATLGAILMKKSLKKVKEKLDWRSVGGALILGVNGIVIKSHGSADAKALKNALLLGDKLAKEKFLEKIKKEIQ